VGVDGELAVDIRAAVLEGSATAWRSPPTEAACKIRLCNQHPAFNSSFAFDGADVHNSNTELSMRWTHGDEVASLQINVADQSFGLHFQGAQGNQGLRF
jgi:hypothetical protein